MASVYGPAYAQTSDPISQRFNRQTYLQAERERNYTETMKELSRESNANYRGADFTD
jgi:hypothetical protein